MSHKVEELVKHLAPEDDVRHLRSEVERLKKALSDRKKDSGLISESMVEVLAAIEEAKPTPLVYKTPKSLKVERPVVLVAHATDWHIGEVVQPEHVEEFGSANFALAQARVEKFAGNLIRSAELARASYAVPTLHVVGTADWVSGGIHEELIRTNEFPEPVQAVKSGYLLGAFIERLAPHFESVVVDVLPAGNHDRITRKPQASEGALNSWGYVVGKIAEQYVSRLRNVKYRLHVGLSTVIEVNGRRYLIAHGDGIQGTWGIPYYGIERQKQKEAMARMNMDASKHFDKIVIGHFHSALDHEHWMIGGSLTGTNAFDHKCGRHSRPHQTSWFVHPEHGEFGFTRWWL